MTRKWNSGPPPYEGWWLTRHAKADKQGWRWWNGEVWSKQCFEDDLISVVGHYAARPEWAHLILGIRWCDYWPKNARVPRVDPRRKA